MHVYLVIYSSLFRVSSFLLIFSLCFWFLFYLPVYQAIEEEASCRQVFSLLLLCMFVSVLFVSICKVLILFVVMHVFFLIIVIFFTDFSSLSLVLFYFPGLSTKKHPTGKFFSLLPSCMFVLLLFIFICKVLFLFVVMHVFFLTNSYFFQLWH